MLVGLHPNLKHGRLGMDSKKFQDILDFNKIDNRILYSGNENFWDEVSKCDFFIFQWTQRDYFRQIARSILPIIENQLKIKCFPSNLSSWIYDDKIREYYILKLHNFPVIQSWIFYDVDNALEFIDKVEYPLVFKLRSGAGSQMVRLVRNKSAAKKYVRLMFNRGARYNIGLPGKHLDELKHNGPFKLARKQLGKLKLRITDKEFFFNENWYIHKNYLYLQKFLPNNSYDTRVVIIGNQAFSIQRRNFFNDFRASGTNNHVYDPQKIDLRFVEIAFQVSKVFGFNVMAYDFLYDENNEPAIAEISYVFGSSLGGSRISNCPGFWDKKMTWHPGKTDVAHCILASFLGKPDLKMINE